MNQNPLIGKKITAVHLAVDGESIRFDLEGGESIVATTYGDCCSQTWIEHVENPGNMLGTVQKAENVDMPGKPGEEEKDGDYIQFYGFKVTTERGSSLLDYRNSSNGYYGGSLEWPGSYDHRAASFDKPDWKKIT